MFQTEVLYLQTAHYSTEYSKYIQGFLVKGKYLISFCKSSDEKIAFLACAFTALAAKALA
jgi:hypothetical protein